MLSGLVGFALTSQVLHFPGGHGPGQHKHIVLLAGEEEYRSEEMLPQLAKILSQKYGFETTVVFSQNDRGEIDPENQTHQPGLEALEKADLCVMMLRFRHWSDGDMKHFVDYYLAGKPIVAIRTSTHAFQYPAESLSPFRDYGWNSKVWLGGFGKQVLGETWVSHWGNHGSQAPERTLSVLIRCLKALRASLGPPTFTRRLRQRTRIFWFVVKSSRA